MKNAVQQHTFIDPSNLLWHLCSHQYAKSHHIQDTSTVPLLREMGGKGISESQVVGIFKNRIFKI